MILQNHFIVLNLAILPIFNFKLSIDYFANQNYLFINNHDNENLD